MISIHIAEVNKSWGVCKSLIILLEVTHNTKASVSV